MAVDAVVGDDGLIYLWLKPDQAEPIVMAQRTWAETTIAVDTALCERQMDQSERIANGEHPDDDWLDRAVACAEGLAELNDTRGYLGIETWPPEDGVHPVNTGYLVDQHADWDYDVPPWAMKEEV